MVASSRRNQRESSAIIALGWSPVRYHRTRETIMEDENRHAFRLGPGLRRGVRTEIPLPTRLVSNEEFAPLPQTAAQRRVEARILADAGRLAPSLGMKRRDFLRTSGGMAMSLLAMNAVVGRFFDVLPVEAAEPAAMQERAGAPYFIFDVQLHYVGAGYDPHDEEVGRKGAVSKQALLGLRRASRRLNPKLASDRGTMADLSWANMVKEVFLDSETAIGLISTPPGPYPQEAVVPPREMTHIRDEINRITQSRRMLAHGLITPQLGQVDLDFMDQQAATLKVDAWKGYTGSAPKGFDRGWFVDDEKIAYPMLERARKLGIPRICLHKGCRSVPSPTTTIPATSSRRRATSRISTSSSTTRACATSRRRRRRARCPGRPSSAR